MRLPIENINNSVMQKYYSIQPAVAIDLPTPSISNIPVGVAKNIDGTFETRKYLEDGTAVNVVLDKDGKTILSENVVASSNNDVLSNHTIAQNLNSSGTTMTLNYDNISNIINKINASVEEIEANLRTVESNLISKINNSWASEAANQYTSKVTDSINRTKYIIETLKLLSQTYTKALNISKNTQQDVSSTVSNI